MSTSSRAGEGSRRRGSPGRRRRGFGRGGGFTLIEALVALVVAGLILPALARALGGAREAARAPMEVLSGITLARDLAAGVPLPPDARARGFEAERSERPARLLVLPSTVAPAPLGVGEAGSLRPDATPSAIRLAAPTGIGAPAGDAAPRVDLRRVSVTLRTPAGRSLALQTVKLVDAPP